MRFILVCFVCASYFVAIAQNNEQKFLNNTEIIFDKDSLPTNIMISYDSIIETLLLKGEKYIGTRYRYGGNCPQGFDCSGFVSFLISDYGYNLPRSSRDQALLGLPVDKKEIKKGDLVFFKGRSIQSRDIGHVGLVVDTADGRIKFIHASRKKGVTYDYVDQVYYKERYVGAKRIFDNNFSDTILLALKINDVDLTDISLSIEDEDSLANDSDVEDAIVIHNSNAHTHTKTYFVKKGDTLYSIARLNNTSVEQIKLNNNLRSDKIYPGQKLIVGAE